MNRTVTMNLSGIIFHIEEEAFEKLNKYLSTIRSYFIDAASRDEIMSDIEARIAEMLQEKISSSKQAILNSDVDSVILQMGRPEDFASEGPQAKDERKESESQSHGKGRRRRVFRDPDEKILGGVCSGIANYFGFDPIWLRAAFAVSIFIFGTGVLLYIILWIIIPQARSTAEKLEMHGEKVDVHNISKAVNEEFEDLKKKMEDFGREVKNEKYQDKVRGSAKRAFDFVGDVLHNIVRTLAKLFTVILIIMAVILVAVFTGSAFESTSFLAFDSHGISLSMFQWSDYILPPGVSSPLFLTAIFLTFGIPLLAIIFGGIKFLMNIKQKNKYLNYTANGLWLTGLIILFVQGVQIAKDFKVETSVQQTINLVQKDITYLKVRGLNKYSYQSSRFDNSHHHSGHIKWEYIERNDEQTFLSCPVKLDIIRSETDSFQIVQIASASGLTQKDAAARAREVRYSFIQRDSILEFEPGFRFNLKDKWRDQDLKLVLAVPVGGKIFLEKGMEYVIYNIRNVSNTLDSEMIGHYWMMKESGLTCIDCDEKEKDTDEDVEIH